MCLHICVCVYRRMCVPMYVHIYVSMYVCMCDMCRCTHGYVRIHECSKRIYTYIRIHLREKIFVYLITSS